MTRIHAIGLAITLAGVLALAVALAAQYFGGLSPCALCLVARWPYRIAIFAGLLALILPPRYAALALWFGLLCFVADSVVAWVQVGVEMGWWKSPLAECSAPSLAGLSGAQLLAALPDRPVTPCDSPVYLIPAVKVSMAAMNLFYAVTTSFVFARVLSSKRLS
jgi:disulfide bond formation protein DsbB